MPTLTQALHTFLQVDRRPATNTHYQFILGKLLLAIGSERDVRRVTYEDLLDYLASRRDETKPSTLGHYIVVIKAFFTWCVKRGYADFSPASDLFPPRLPKDPTRSRAIPPDELRRMVEYARLTHPRNYALLMFLVDTGCRVGGLVSLTQTNLHLEEGFAHIVEKGGVWQKARFGRQTAEAITVWLTKRPEVKHPYVWTANGPAYRPLTRSAVEAVAQTLARRTGASRPWGPHAIRHAVGHAYAKAGVPPSVTQRKLGHSNVGTTLNFYYPEDDAYVDLVSRRLELAALREEDELRAPAAKVISVKTDRKSGS